jgi:hypothetical protein
MVGRRVFARRNFAAPSHFFSKPGSPSRPATTEIIRSSKNRGWRIFAQSFTEPFNGGLTMMKLLAPRDVGRRLNVSASRVIQLDREGALRAMRDSAGRRFYDAEEVERFAVARESQAPRPRPGSPRA